MKETIMKQGTSGSHPNQKPTETPVDVGSQTTFGKGATAPITVSRLPNGDAPEMGANPGIGGHNAGFNPGTAPKSSATPTPAPKGETVVDTTGVGVVNGGKH